jgi:hypothetical protein
VVISRKKMSPRRFAAVTLADGFGGREGGRAGGREGLREGAMGGEGEGGRKEGIQEHL